jgi:hypothetical protein
LAEEILFLIADWNGNAWGNVGNENMSEGVQEIENIWRVLEEESFEEDGNIEEESKTKAEMLS